MEEKTTETLSEVEIKDEEKSIDIDTNDDAKNEVVDASVDTNADEKEGKSFVEQEVESLISTTESTQKRKRGRPKKILIDGVNKYDDDVESFALPSFDDAKSEEKLAETEAEKTTKKSKKKKKSPEEYEFIAGEIINVVNYGGAAGAAYLTKSKPEIWELNDDEKKTLQRSLQNVLAYYQTNADNVNPMVVFVITMFMIYLNKWLFFRASKDELPS